MSAETATVTPLASKEQPDEQSDLFDRAYWIRHCEGYRVDSGHGRLGFVDEVRDEGDEMTIVVRAGLLGRRLLHFSAADIAFVVPRQQALFLYSSARLIGSSGGPQTP